MKTENELRLKALDPNESFIVQAPAGSGKTELLTQRYLQLLSLVKSPEEVVAITFTRKAAAEMRERVLHALNNRASVHSAHHKITQELAKKVRDTDQKQNWNLAKNPARLRILTIDALCAGLANQMPLLARLAPEAKITEDASYLYEKAVEALFNNIDDDSTASEALQHLLAAMDNRADSLAELLVEILAQREQWLGLLVSHYQNPEPLRARLEEGLQQAVVESLIQLDQKLNRDMKNELYSLCQLAATHLIESDDDHRLCTWLDLDCFPKPSLEYHTHWLALSELLFTKTLNWRKSFDKRVGFPSEAKDKQTQKVYKAAKEKIKTLIAELAAEDSIHDLVCNLISAPASTYTEEQWSLLKEIIKLLPRLVAELNLVFRNEHSIDFIELNLSALRALGDADHPTDLSLYLDYQIKHLLIDEFQDTSLVQFRLIEQLTANWHENEAKSLFLVGDPMQSIYRFRNAEVGLFLRVQQQGIGNIKLHSLQLAHNFRSDPIIIDWLNENFLAAFPKAPDIASGAVAYFAAVANKSKQQQAGIHYYPLLDSTAAQTAAIVREYQVLDPKARIAILVRSRRQLQEIIPQLKLENLKFKAVELELLAERIEIEDLLSLTRALTHLGDRSAWLAILRAPWCGLKLADILSIAQHAENKPLWYSLYRFKNIVGLSQDALLRLHPCVAIWQRYLQPSASMDFSEHIKNCWLELHGPACLDDINQLKNTDAYFELLRTLSSEGTFSLISLNRKLSQLYAEAHPEADDSLQVMTIHKAKGLEFDHVILPHLESIGPNESTRLLRWLERPRLTQDSDLILAPFKTPGVETEAIHDYLLGIEKRKLEHELLRLFYVAASRAKLSLHLLFELAVCDAGDIRNPDARSLLNYLWPKLQTELNFSELFSNSQAVLHNEKKPRLLKRLMINADTTKNGLGGTCGS